LFFLQSEQAGLFNGLPNALVMAWGVASNLRKVHDSIILDLEDLKGAGLRAAAQLALKMMKERILRGRASDSHPIGKYTKSAIRLRKSKGRQTDFIDLYFSGDMLDNMIVEKSGNSRYVIGFQDQEQADKADFQEDRYGIIFELTEYEAEESLTAISTILDEILH
jgi:hypothetical protein